MGGEEGMNGANGARKRNFWVTAAWTIKTWMRVPWLANNLLWMLLKEFWKWFLQSSRTSKDFLNPWPGALSTAKLRATRAHLDGNRGLRLGRCHLHDCKLLPEVNYGGYHHRHQPRHRPGVPYSDNLPSKGGQHNHLLEKKFARNQKKILWTKNVKCVKVW